MYTFNAARLGSMSAGWFVGKMLQIEDNIHAKFCLYKIGSLLLLQNEVAMGMMYYSNIIDEIYGCFRHLYSIDILQLQSVSPSLALSIVTCPWPGP